MFTWLNCCVHVHIHNSYLPVIGVHEMHGRMHPNYWQIPYSGKFLLVLIFVSGFYLHRAQQGVFPPQEAQFPPLEFTGKFT